MTAETTYSVTITRIDDGDPGVISASWGIRDYDRAADRYAEAMRRADEIVAGPRLPDGRDQATHVRVSLRRADARTAWTMLNYDAHRAVPEHVHRFTERVEDGPTGISIYRCACGSTTR